jgi:hypothetical protein
MIGDDKVIGEETEETIPSKNQVVVEKINARFVPHLIDATTTYTTRLPAYLLSKNIANKVLQRFRFNIGTKDGFDYRCLNTNIDQIDYNKDSFYVDQPPVIITSTDAANANIEDYVYDKLIDYSEWILGEEVDTEFNLDDILGYNRAAAMFNTFIENKNTQPQQYNTVPSINDFLILVKINSQPSKTLKFVATNYYQVVKTIGDGLKLKDQSQSQEAPVFNESNRLEYKALLAVANKFSGYPTSKIQKEVQKIQSLSISNTTKDLNYLRNEKDLELNGFLDVLSSAWNATKNVLKDVGVATVGVLANKVTSLFTKQQ